VTVPTASLTNPGVDDASLVARSLAGSPDAFGGIVSRYQALICSVAYSSTGSLSRSEDLAQETFLTAWKELRSLREPARLRPWLCGIARNLVNNSRRRESLEPATGAEPLESAAEAPAEQPLATEQAISREEEAILWRSIERIPEIYREPMVLFYREHQSVEKVALSLGLGEDVVRQRLSRGRKSLHEQVLAFVEGALERTSPGEAFTLGVVSALPAFSASATAAAVAATAAKGTALAKAAGLLAAFTALIGLATSLLSGYAGVRASLNVMRTARERALLFHQLKVAIAVAMFFVGAVFALILPMRFWSNYPNALVALGIALLVGYSGAQVLMMWRFTRETRVVRAAAQELEPERFTEKQRASSGRGFEYRSRATLLGIPLVHIRYAPPRADSSPALGWIAVGDRAVGVLFALGAMAAGTVSVGSVAVGVVAVGGASLGVISLGGTAFGILALGTMAAGVFALGAFAFGWTGASGAVAVAHTFALGRVALGEHPNDEAALVFASQHHVATVFYSLLALCFLLAVLPTAFIAWRTRRRSSPSPTSE
jgi:RNA polymerase sigma factor (sigma-70 family)